MDTFGYCLEKARKKAGYKSAGEFGKKLGVSHVTVRAWEKDEYKPSSDNIFEIVNVLGEHSYGLPNVHSSKKIDESNAEYVGHVDVWDSNTELDEDEVEVPFFMDVELAAGVGGELAIEIQGPKLRFSKSTLRRCGVQAEAAACVKVSGNSMEPRLFDGDVVGVNTLDKHIVDGKVYAINHAGLLRVKRIYRMPGGGLRINSINHAEHPDELYSQQEVADIMIIGKVFWHSSIWD
ncbi:MAG: XRE family transcriptional regulator [Alteromonas sp.]|nr:MAG: XRE family transcriptional regulator [Alteromonas sp.]